MRRLILGLLLAGATAVGGGVMVPLVLAGSASADSPNAAAVIHDDGTCGMPGSDANGNMSRGGFGRIAVRVTNNNRATITCTALPGTLMNLSGTAQHYSDFLCFLQSARTGQLLVGNDSHATVAANGAGSVHCTFSFT